MAVEWTITIEGKNEFGEVCRREVRITRAGTACLTVTSAFPSMMAKDHGSTAERGHDP